MRTLVKFAAIGGVMVVLALANLYMLGRPIDTSPILNGARAAKQLAGGATADETEGTGHIEELTFVQTFSRPLFSQTRRKFQPPKPKPKPEPAKVAKQQPAKKPVQPPKFRVVGISINVGGSRALIVGGPVGKPQWFLEGEDIGRWKLAAIAGEAITVTQGGQEVSIALYPTEPQGQ